jgi:hypothetical protein
VVEKVKDTIKTLLDQFHDDPGQNAEKAKAVENVKYTFKSLLDKFTEDDYQNELEDGRIKETANKIVNEVDTILRQNVTEVLLKTSQFQWQLTNLKTKGKASVIVTTGNDFYQVRRSRHLV